MNLRAVSGLLIPKSNRRKQGSATITFRPLQIDGDVEQPHHSHSEAIGANADFVNEPCKMVALRQITMDDTDTASSGPGSDTHVESWSIDDRFLPNNTEEAAKTGMVVSWRAGRDAEIHEISFMVMGETN